MGSSIDIDLPVPPTSPRPPLGNGGGSGNGGSGSGGSGSGSGSGSGGSGSSSSSSSSSSIQPPPPPSLQPSLTPSSSDGLVQAVIPWDDTANTAYTAFYTKKVKLQSTLTAARVQTPSNKGQVDNTTNAVTNAANANNTSTDNDDDDENDSTQPRRFPMVLLVDSRLRAMRSMYLRYLRQGLQQTGLEMSTGQNAVSAIENGVTNNNHNNNINNNNEDQSSLAAGGKKRRMQAVSGQGQGQGQAAGQGQAPGQGLGESAGAGPGLGAGDNNHHITAWTPLSPLGPHGVFPPLDSKQRVVWLHLFYTHTLFNLFIMSKPNLSILISSLNQTNPTSSNHLSHSIHTIHPVLSCGNTS